MYVCMYVCMLLMMLLVENVIFAVMCEECCRVAATCRCPRCEGNMCGTCFSRVSVAVIIYMISVF